MLASVVREYGGPEQLRLESVPDLVPGPGELLVRVEAAGVQFVETQVRAGLMAGTPLAPPVLPWVPGNEVAGTVAATGEGVDPSLVGARVAGRTQQGGGYAESALLREQDIHRIPESLGAAAAVSLLGTGRTAVGLTELAELGPDDVVLVESAASAVGTLLLQLARQASVRQVVGLARGERKLALAEEFGADTVLDYAEPGWSSALHEAGVSVVFDGVGGAIGREAFELLRPGGRFVAFGFSSGVGTAIAPGEAEQRGVTSLAYWGPPTGARSPEVQFRQTRDLLAAVAAGRIRTLVGQTFPLRDAAAAHAAIERRETVGKTVLLP
ncbi:zinc-binding dehydrogenase [Streptacidiphilus fuscans]|uniref:Zinc-binding dehydrogenase n=1 Tax=Streptacidiphilus fuscans TaxID=2789292 RepID=A0A931FFE7_9ACTN|nr:zinc-binding dehydrogenase [Streptacidiphilus fuscans]MBF9068344.1 zinc-binding dehydrogenase [Streptacidiphilus fuscans]